MSRRRPHCECCGPCRIYPIMDNTVTQPGNWKLSTDFTIESGAWVETNSFGNVATQKGIRVPWSDVNANGPAVIYGNYEFKDDKSRAWFYTGPEPMHALTGVQTYYLFCDSLDSDNFHGVKVTRSNSFLPNGIWLNHNYTARLCKWEGGVETLLGTALSAATDIPPLLFCFDHDNGTAGLNTVGSPSISTLVPLRKVTGLTPFGSPQWGFRAHSTTGTGANFGNIGFGQMTPGDTNSLAWRVECRCKSCVAVELCGGSYALGNVVGNLQE